ncbi:hypothetical protein DFA_11102 [Cavenderia fasciculata]|uniref:Transmembrane protein n=1 Tax=Cavenderia fasciculata TaxID=261658 RepID=F4QET0_CACFS|nr:uncharacterized protein DFA_11102 [Cavenderia fasciculata]EGG13341.1 hypothetical protein DFA_11102 [Cavenderia fasciculata]|eukprot:XP_004350045.1 hypothetical protein DFA_11102 [Cavenderia fasciculata]
MYILFSYLYHKRGCFLIWKKKFKKSIKELSIWNIVIPAGAIILLYWYPHPMKEFEVSSIKEYPRDNMYKIITIVSLLFAIFAISSAGILPGNWIWHQNINQPCGTTSYVNVTTISNKFASFGNSQSYTLLVNCTIYSDNTFTGLGTLYIPGTYSISGYTNVKGQLINAFSLVAVYASNSNPYYPGSTEYYVFSNCYSNSDESSNPMIASNFEDNGKGLDSIGRPL